MHHDDSFIIIIVNVVGFLELVYYARHEISLLSQIFLDYDVRSITCLQNPKLFSPKLFFLSVIY